MTNLIWFFGIYALAGVVTYTATIVHFGLGLFRVLDSVFDEVSLSMMSAWGRVYAIYLLEYWNQLPWYWRIIKVICWPAACYDKVRYRGIGGFMDRVGKVIKDHEND